jgi:hypothetical protein
VRLRSLYTAVLLLVLSSAASCGDGASEPTLPARLEFSSQTLDLGYAREALLELANTGGLALGPVEIEAGLVRDASGATVPGSRVLASPNEIPTLNPGAGATVSLELSLPGTLVPGLYDAVITARAGTDAETSVVVHFQVPTAVEAAALSLVIGSVPDDLRRGDVAALSVEVRDYAGALLEGAPVSWTMEPAGAGYLGGNGQFVGYAAGSVTLTASVGDAADTVVFTVRDRGLSGEFRTVGQGREQLRFTSDLWLSGDYAYTGTWGGRTTPEGYHVGNTLFTWDVRDATNPTKVHSLEVDARTVNDVKVRADGRVAVITHEGSNDGLNGITLLDLAAPARPTVVGRFSAELESGVHNVWLDGDYAYLVVDGVGVGLRILDISDPANPRIVARYYGG